MRKSTNLKRQRTNAKSDLAKAEAYVKIANHAIRNAYECMKRIALNKGVKCAARRNARRCCKLLAGFIHDNPFRWE